MAKFYQHPGKQLQSTLPAALEMLQKSGNPLDIKRGKLSNKTDYETVSDKRKSGSSFKYRLLEIIQREIKKFDPVHGSVRCGKAVIPKQANVEIQYRTDTKKVTYSKIEECRKCWVCPTCVARLGAQKKAELIELQKVINDLGLHAYMMTLTIPHSLRDRLIDLLEKLKVAQGKFIDGMRAGKLRKIFSKVGHITVLAVTYSEKSGWHPHLHILVISELFYTDKELINIEENLYKAWSAKCKLSGLKAPHRKYAVKLQNCASNQDKLDTRVINYLIKHRFAKEKSSTKLNEDIAHGAGITIWDIAQLASDKNKRNAEKYRLILQEYTVAMVSENFVRRSKLLTSFLKDKGYDFKDAEVQKIKKREQKQENLKKTLRILSITQSLWQRICKASYAIRRQLLRTIALDIQYLGLDCRIYPRTDRLLKYIQQSKLFD